MVQTRKRCAESAANALVNNNASSANIVNTSADLDDSLQADYNSKRSKTTTDLGLSIASNSTDEKRQTHDEARDYCRNDSDVRLEVKNASSSNGRSVNQEKSHDGAVSGLKTPKREVKKNKRPILETVQTSSRPRRAGVWSPDHLLVNKKSRLINTDVKILFNLETWNFLTHEEQNEVYRLLPKIDHHNKSTATDHESTHIDPSTLFKTLNNDAFKTAYRELQEDLDNGAYESSYIKRADEAAHLRMTTLCDAIDRSKNDLFEQYWGQRQKTFHENAGEATNISLLSMGQAGLLRAGDILEYRRQFKKHPAIHKQLLLIDINLGVTDDTRKGSNCVMTFSMPPEKSKFLSQKNRENTGDDRPDDAIVTALSFSDLEKQIIHEYDKAESILFVAPNGNVWKVFWLHRNHESLGTLHQIRQKFFSEQQNTIR